MFDINVKSYKFSLEQNIMQAYLFLLGYIKDI